jgi:hypothetical protein
MLAGTHASHESGWERHRDRSLGAGAFMVAFRLVANPRDSGSPIESLSPRLRVKNRLKDEAERFGLGSDRSAVGRTGAAQCCPGVIARSYDIRKHPIV